METGNKEWTAKQYDEAVDRLVAKEGVDNHPLWEDMVVMAGLAIPMGKAKVLDLGCGTGRFWRALNIFRPNQLRYLGIDFSPKSIEIAKKEHHGEFLCMDLFDPDVGDIFQNFDTFVMIEVLEHLDRDLDLIKNIPVGCRTILSVPSYSAKGSGHVRKFGHVNDVVKRYSPYIDPSWVAVHGLKSGNYIYIMAGEKK